MPVVRDPKKHKPRRKPSLAEALRAARRAGVSVCQAEIGPDGKVVLTFGQPTTKPNHELTVEDLKKLL
jgi:hypothetical protein